MRKKILTLRTPKSSRITIKKIPEEGDEIFVQLVEAIWAGNFKMVKFLANNRNVNEICEFKGNITLLIKALITKPKIRQYLASLSNVNDKFTAHNIDTSSINKVFHDKFTENSKNMSLINAVLHGEYKMVKNLLNIGVNPNAKDENGYDAMMYAELNQDSVNYFKIIELLNSQIWENTLNNNRQPTTPLNDITISEFGQTSEKL